MQSNYKPKTTNRPGHLLINDSFYFFTIRTIDGQWFLRPDLYKQILFNTLKEKVNKFGFSLIAYVILQNHYHIILKISNAKNISKFIRELNGASARAINKADHAIYRKIWWNYFDHVIRDEIDFFKHLNYIHQNSIKHGLTKDFSYKFSSYNTWVEKKGRGYMNQIFEKYPIIDFKSFNDEF